jgi:hypothetical protein
VDLERAEVVDLLPDRDAECVKGRLKGHPSIELISRDRAAAYAQAAAEAVPKAQQVADRWHMLRILREAIERLLERQSDAVDEAMKAAALAEESPQSLEMADIAQGVTTAEPTSPPQPLIEYLVAQAGRFLFSERWQNAALSQRPQLRGEVPIFDNFFDN